MLHAFMALLVVFTLAQAPDELTDDGECTTDTSCEEMWPECETGGACPDALPGLMPPAATE